MIVYDKRTGIIDAVVPNLDYAEHYPREFKDNLIGLELDEYPDDIFNYRVVEGKLIRLLDEEMREKRLYGKILSSEERLLNEMKPSSKEVRDAEEEIKLLKLLEELI